MCNAQVPNIEGTEGPRCFVWNSEDPQSSPPHRAEACLKGTISSRPSPHNSAVKQVGAWLVD